MAALPFRLKWRYVLRAGFGVENGGRADTWVSQQAAYDLLESEKSRSAKGKTGNVSEQYRRLIPQQKKDIHMKTIALAAIAILLFGCGVGKRRHGGIRRKTPDRPSRLCGKETMDKLKNQSWTPR